MRSPSPKFPDLSGINRENDDSSEPERLSFTRKHAHFRPFADRVSAILLRESITPDQGGYREIMQADAEQGDEDVVLDPSALTQALSTIEGLLDVGQGRVENGFLAGLEAAVKDFALDQSIRPLYGSPAEQKRLIAQLAKSLDKSLSLLLQLSPEYLVAIEAMIEGTDPGDGRWVNSVEQVDRLTKAVYNFSDNYKPKRGATTNLPLEEAVRALVPLLEHHTGGRVEVSMNKSKGGSPALTSPEAKAMMVLLRVADPKLGEATIANMIDKVRREPTASHSHFEAIWAADPRMALDACLHPRRREGINPSKIV